MAVTRIKNNQITDSTITGSKLVEKTITSGLLEDNLTYSSDFTISGNLTVSGTTSTVDTTNTLVADPLLVLSRGETGTPSQDSGFIIERGTSSNVGFIWDESADVFALVNTTEDGSTSGDIAISSYADAIVADITASSGSIGNIDISGNSIVSSDTNGDISLIPNGTGDINLSSDTVVVGDSNTDATVTTNGTGDLILNTNGGTDSGSITIADGANGDITIAPNGTGSVNITNLVNSDLTDNRVVLAGTGGALEDSANLTFDGTSLSVTGNVIVDNITIDANTISSNNTDGNINLTPNGAGEVVASTLTVSDLTDNRVVLAGTSGAVEDSANLTFNGSTLAVTGVANISSNLNVSGEATLASATISDLTDNRVLIAGASGAVEDSANLTFDGTSLSVTGNVVVDNITLDANTISSNNTDGNINLTPNGAGEVVASSMTVSDLTDNRLVVVGASGALEDDANLTWDGSAMAVTGGVDITGDLDIDNININGNDITSTNSNGDINLTPNGTGEVVASTLVVSDLTDNRVLIAGASGAVEDSANLTFDGTTLSVTGNVTVDNITVDGDTISSVHDTITIDPATAGSGGTVVIAGNLQVTGTTTTVDSTVVTIADPVFQLGEDSDDSLDRGIKALYNDGVDSKNAFFGLDESATEFVFIADATDSASVFSGSLGAAAFGSLRVTDLTDNRLLVAGANGEIEDSANLTFDGTTLSVTGVAEIDNVQIDGNTITTTAGNLNIDSNGNEVIIDSLSVSDLTNNRVLLAGTSGAVEDSTNLTFDGSTLSVTGVANVSSNLNVSGEATLASATVSDLTAGRVTYAGVDGALVDSANLAFDGTNLTVSSATVSDLTSGRVVLAGTSGAVEDSANLTFDGSTLVVTGVANVSSNLNVSGEATLASATVSDLTDNRIVVAGTGGALEDDANLTWNGSAMSVTGGVDITGDLDIDNINIDGNAITSTNTNGNIDITPDGTGATNITNLNITGLTADRVMVTDSSGTTATNNNLTYDGTTLGVTGNVTVDNITIDGDTISSAHTTLTIDPASAGTGGTVVIAGDLTVQGTTTTVDSTVVTIADPVFQIGEDTADSLDRGIKALYNDGTSKTAFFGLDESASEFIFIEDATDTASVFTGSLGAAAFGSLRVTDLTDNRVLLAGTSGEVEDSANLTFDGSTLTVTGVANISSDLNVSGEATLASATVSDLTSGRVTLAGVDGALEDSANLTFNGTTLTVTGVANVSSNLNVSGEATLASATVSDLTSGRVTLAGTSGALEDSANLTFDGSTLTVTGTANVAGALNVDNVQIDGNSVTTSAGNLTLTSTGGEVTATSLAVSDLTAGRVTLAGASGALEDSANLTFNGSTLAVTGVANISSNLNVSGEATLASATVSDLTSGRVVLAGTDGSLEDNGNLAFDGTTLTVTGVANISSDLNVDGEATLASATVSDLTSGRVVLAGVDGAIEDSANLAFDGTTLTVTGVANISANLNVSGEATLASATVSDLTDNRLVVAGTGGSLEDDANLTWDGSALVVTGGIDVTGDLDVDNLNFDGNAITSTNSNGNIDITPDGTGATNITNLNIAGLTAERVMITDATGATATDNNLTWDGADLGVTGSVTVDNITIDGDTISSVHDTITIDPATAGVGGTVVIAGNLQVTGTTTTVDSTVVTIADPVFQLGEDSDDSLDRGIKALYNDGTSKTAFFGLDESATEFVFIADATDTSSVFTGSLGAAAFGSLRVTDLTDTRITFVGANGEIEDSANLTFDGTTLNATALEVDNVQIDGNTITTTAGNLNIDSNGNEVLIDSLTINDLTDNRVLIAGTSGAVEDSANLTFDGSTLTVTGVANVSSDLNVDGEATLASATVSDLTAGRLTYAGVDGALIDNANLTFDGSTLTVTGVANISSDLNVSGEATLASATVSDLTSGRVTLAGAAGSLEDSANLTFNGSTLTVSGDVAIDNVTVDANTVSTSAGNLTLTSTGGEVTATSLAVSDLTAGRVTLAGTSGALEDSANLTFDGSTLVVTGVANVSSDLNVSGESTLASATVSDLTSGRVTLAGTSGALEDSANLTFNGTTLTTTQLAVDNVTVDANTVSTSDGNLTLDSNAGEVIATSLAVSDLTATRVTLAGTNGALEDSANLTFDGTSLGVTGNVVVDNITLDGNSITSSNALTLDAAGSSSIVINEAGADVDFRVESDTEINALFVEGSSGNIGFKTAAPTAGATITINSTDSIIVPSGTTAQRPGTAAEGMMRYNSTLGQLEFYDNTEWKVAGAEFTIITADSFEGDGSTVAFTLSEDSTSAGLLVALNGVVQDPGTAYSVSGTTLTFTEAPASGDNIDARIITTTTSVTQLTDGNTSVVVDDSTPEIRNVVDGTTIFKTTSGGVVPNANVTYDLGTDSLRWKDLYLSGSSIYLGDLVIKDNGDNSMGVFQSDGVTEAVINVSAEDAAKWTTARTITLGGDLTGNVSIDGSSDVTLTSTVVGDIEVDTVTIGTVSTADSATATLATVSETASTLYDAASYAGAKVVVSARDTVTGETQMSELLITNTGSAASATEYGVVHTGASPLATYDVDVSSGDVRLLITGASANSTKYQVSLNLMKV